MRHSALPGASETSSIDGANTLPHASQASHASQGSTAPVAPRSGSPAFTARVLGEWITICRPKLLLLSQLPAWLALTYLWAAGDTVSRGLALCTLIALALVHAGANVLDEYVDYERRQRTGLKFNSRELFRSGSTLAASHFEPLSVLRFGIALLVAGALMGIPLTGAGGFPVTIIGLAGMLLAVLYSSTSIALKRLPGGGELATCLALGPGVVSVTILVQGYSLTASILLAALSLGLLACSIVSVVHVSTIERDRREGRSTPSAVNRLPAARTIVVAVIALAYLCAAGAMARSAIPYSLLTVFFAVPSAVIAATGVLHAQSEEAWQLATSQVARAYFLFVIWAFVGLLVVGIITRVLALVSFVG